MKRWDIEKKYEQQGCNDYHLRNTDDLLLIHGVNFLLVKGYKDLTEENAALYQQFIVNYWNAYGLDTRMTMEPKGIYFVEDQEFDFEYVDDYDGEKMSATAKRIITEIAASGKKKLLHKYIDNKYINKLPLVPRTRKQYLRFEYKIDGHNEWMHVKSATQWY